jgi:LacI family transcriptional regulator
LPKHWKGDAVTADNEGGAYAATRALLSLGHRRIATITGPLHLTNAAERLAGFRRAMREENVAVAPEYVQEATFERYAGYSKTMLLLRMIPRPTAIFAGNDLIAFGVLQAIREAGLRCPEDVSLIGFDDMEPAAMLNPELSSVSQPGYQLGTTAASILIDRVDGDLSPAKQVVLQTAVQLRHSVVRVQEEEEAVTRRKKERAAR